MNRSLRLARRLARRAAFGALAAALGLSAIATAALASLRVLDPVTTALQVQRRIEAARASRPYVKRYRPAPLSRISDHLEHAVIAAEDGRFYAHAGIDWMEMRKAAEDNRRRGRLWRGGSTITQQLVKNLFLTTQWRFVRKAVEIPLALAADLVLPKRRILELYLNVVEWGPGVYGAEAAAEHHFGASAASLTREQAARLAACLPAPRRRTPRRMDGYARVILGRMERMGW